LAFGPEEAQNPAVLFERRRRAPFWARLLTMLFVFVAVPGAQELVDDLAHYARDGHTAHDQGHEGEDPDHCCSGLFHLCPCHAHASATQLESVGFDALSTADQWLIVGASGALPPGHRASPFRPPAC
jgi:hypothetical protein